MALGEAWRELHRERFSGLPLDCGNSIDPGLVGNADFRDWSLRPSTGDQRRIERYIDQYDLRQKRLLHIGIGNSGLAKRLHKRVNEIVGTTVDEPEIKLGQSLALPNYSVVLHNKYADKGERIAGIFDFIVDNNPTSACCCLLHLAQLFALYAEKLADNGQVIVDMQGLGWVSDGVNLRWRFDFDDLAAVSAAAGFSAVRADRKICVLSKSRRQRPDRWSLWLHRLRTGASAPLEVARRAPAAISYAKRKCIKFALICTVPWGRLARYRRRAAAEHHESEPKSRRM